MILVLVLLVGVLSKLREEGVSSQSPACESQLIVSIFPTIH